MAGENKPSIFASFGNKNSKFKNSPSLVPDSRAFVNYADKRTNPFPKTLSFTGSEYHQIDPTVIAFDLTTARVDFELSFSGNMIWYQSSTNATDVIRVKFERTGAVGLPLLPGNALQGVAYTRLFISNGAIPGATGFLVLLKDSPEHPVRVL